MESEKGPCSFFLSKEDAETICTRRVNRIEREPYEDGYIEATFYDLYSPEGNVVEKDYMVSESYNKKYKYTGLNGKKIEGVFLPKEMGWKQDYWRTPEDFKKAVLKIQEEGDK